jgi:hypothetical protein
MTDNTKASFVVDEEKHKEEMEDLYALKKVKDAISKKKKEIKDKDFLEKHPKLKDIVQSHRRRKIEMEKPKEEGAKIPLKTSHPKVEVELDEKPVAKPKADLDIDKLADKVVEKMNATPKKEVAKPKVSDWNESDDECAPDIPKPSAEERFNKKIAKAPPPVQVTVAKNGKWF